MVNMVSRGKRKGSVWRCISPILIYWILMSAASAVVMFMYYMEQGVYNTTGMAMEELIDQITASMLEDLSVLNFRAMTVGYILLIPVFVFMYVQDKMRDFVNGADDLDGKSAPFYMYAFLVFLGAASCVAASNMISMSGLVEASESYSSAVSVLYSGGIFAESVVLGLIAPTAEELLFRGLVYRRLKELNPTIPAMVFASLIFALLHGNLVQGIYAFIMGILLCYVYERYQSISAPIIMHMSSNLMAVAASETHMLDFMYSSTGAFYIATFVFCIVIIGVIYLIERYVRPVTEEVG